MASARFRRHIVPMIIILSRLTSSFHSYRRNRNTMVLPCSIPDFLRLVHSRKVLTWKFAPGMRVGEQNTLPLV